MPDRDDERWELWGPLAERYRTERPRRILALDGGGIRGMITLGVLARLERDLAEATGGGDDFRLCDFFDLIGGTSTGAIIAAGLARGMSVGGDHRLLRETSGRIAFERRELWMRWQSLYGDGQPRRHCSRRPSARTPICSPSTSLCLLTVVTRNATTDSAWPISSNPFAKYNDPARSDCNLDDPAVEARPGQHRRAGLLPARGRLLGPRTTRRSRSCSSTAAPRPTTTRRSSCTGWRPSPPTASAGRRESDNAPDRVGRDRQRPGAGRRPPTTRRPMWPRPR